MSHSCDVLPHPKQQWDLKQLNQELNANIVTLRRGLTYTWVLGLSGVPDAPHAVNVSLVAEGNSVGELKEPPVDARRQCTDDLSPLASTQVASNLCFQIQLTECLNVTWETLFIDNKLFVEIPNGILPEGSKESLVTLLEYAEQKLMCSHVIICFKKDRKDRALLIRTFMFLGFSVVPPGDPIVPNIQDSLFMIYTVEDMSELE